jgi:hypothetical protein
VEVTCLNLVLVKIPKKMGYNKGGGNREGSGTFMSNPSCQRIEN